ncbi:circularly permuted type 2 ATP-grasp protein [Brachybacterium fresconis]|uniref:Circularly permuted ATP-grasp superfamily protein n=1 Tax=Brachybacterium fresconis TaxID=173363 RepID=A0ABS4YFT1_9MICO|nr:circularly permuted type 2 ATP-grasp protein [Brachybacterium fresconis]MBP2407650.1 putative circularly permuted ATP-grasp superfamily protein [Brachybacterium fresconis]
MPASSLFRRVQPGSGSDEMFAADGSVRDTYAALHDALAGLGPEEFRARSESLAHSYLDQGITFDYAGEERPFPIDAIPRVIAAEEWARVSQGVSQRVRALEHFLDDLYTDQRAIADGVIPSELVTSSSYVVDAMRGYRPPNGVRIHISGIDLVRDGSGEFRVLEDNVRTPSGVSYVLSNRRAMAQTFPELFAPRPVRRVGEYSGRLLGALQAAAPDTAGEEPTVVVLTPGRYNSAYFEHSLLARTMGVDLVEADDLVERGERIYMRTTAGLRRVDVIYKRTDDDFIDPEVFRPDSVLGVPGLVRAILAGNVVVSNAIGNGIGDDKLTYTYVPDLIRYYLGQEPILPNVDTWRLEEPDSLAEVLDRLDELAVKPVDGSGGKGIVIGPAASREELDALRDRLLTDPRGWIAQPVVQLSTIPTLVDEGPEERHVDLRPFALNSGDDVWVLPGGLTRVALPRGEMIVNSSRGGGSKDTWVLATERAATPAAGSGRQRSGTSAAGEERIEDPLDEDYDGFEDLPEDAAEQTGREPDPVTSAIPLLDDEDLDEPERPDSAPADGAAPETGAAPGTDGTSATAAEKEEDADAQPDR